LELHRDGARRVFAGSLFVDVELDESLPRIYATQQSETIDLSWDGWDGGERIYVDSDQENERSRSQKVPASLSRELQ
jgi:hypothetical protein